MLLPYAWHVHGKICTAGMCRYEVEFPTMALAMQCDGGSKLFRALTLPLRTLL